MSPIVQTRETELQREELLTVTQPSADPGLGPGVILKPVLVTAQFLYLHGLGHFWSHTVSQTPRC